MAIDYIFFASFDVMLSS